MKVGGCKSNFSFYKKNEERVQFIWKTRSKILLVGVTPVPNSLRLAALSINKYKKRTSEKYFSERLQQLAIETLKTTTIYIQRISTKAKVLRIYGIV